MRRLAIVLACAPALLLAGCGGSSSSTASGTESAATVAPASAAAYVAVDTDLDSDQWKQAQELLDRFPGRDRLIQELEKQLGEENLDFERDIDPALGPETAVVVLTGRNDDVVVLTQPDDKAKLDALLKRVGEDEDETYVTREVDDWTAIAETEQVLDAFDKARDEGSLDDDETFQDAIGKLPDEALVKAYVSGEAVQRAATEATGSADVLTGGGRLETITVALEALEEGAKFSGAIETEGGIKVAAYEPKLLDRVPDDALAVFSFKDLGKGLQQAKSTPGFQPFLGQIQQALGVSFDELARLFAGETALYARSGSPIPEVTLLLDVADTDASLATLDRLAARATGLLGARTGSTDVDGTPVKYIEIQGVRISYGAFAGIVAITSGPSGIRDAKGGGDKFPDDERFNAAKDAAGMGDETNGFFYVDLKDSIPLIQGFAGLAGEEIPPDVTANLAPLESFLVYATQDGDTTSFGGILGITK